MGQIDSETADIQLDMLINAARTVENTGAGIVKVEAEKAINAAIKAFGTMITEMENNCFGVYLSLNHWSVCPPGTNTFISRPDDFPGIDELFDPMGAPTDNSGNGKERRVNFRWNIEHSVYKVRIEVYIRAHAFVYLTDLQRYRNELRRFPSGRLGPLCR